MVKNIKAQSRKLYDKVASTPVAKGIKGALYEEGIVGRGIKTQADKINQRSLKKISLDQGISLDEVKVNGMNFGGMAPESLRKGGVENMKMMEDAFNSSFLYKNLGGEPLKNMAKSKVSLGNTMSADEISKVLGDTYTEFDRETTLMATVNIAKEYYGQPIMQSIGGIKSGDYNEAAKGIGKAGARIGATGLVVAGTVTATKGTVNLAKSGIDRLRGNDYERK